MQKKCSKVELRWDQIKEKRKGRREGEKKSKEGRKGRKERNKDKPQSKGTEEEELLKK